MSDTPQGEGWWLASDGKWYPPETAPGYQQPPPAPGAPLGPGAPIPPRAPGAPGTATGGFPGAGYPTGGSPAGGYPPQSYGQPYGYGYAPMPAQPKWYENVAVIILALLCCWPVGLAFVWSNSQWDQKTKLTWTAIVGGIVVAGFILRVFAFSASFDTGP